MATHEERRRVGIRLSVLQYLITVVFSGLAVSFWVLQVVQHAKFEEIAENNHQRTLGLRARAASCSTATASSSSRTATRTASLS